MEINNQVITIRRGTLILAIMSEPGNPDQMKKFKFVLEVPEDTDILVSWLKTNVISQHELTPEERTTWQEDSEDRAGLNR